MCLSPCSCLTLLLLPPSGSKKGKASGPSLDDNDLTAIVDVPAAREEMEQALHDLQQDMVQRLPLRTSIGVWGRAWCRCVRVCRGYKRETHHCWTAEPL